MKVAVLDNGNVGMAVLSKLPMTPEELQALHTSADMIAAVTQKFVQKGTPNMQSKCPTTFPVLWRLCRKWNEPLPRQDFTGNKPISCGC